MEGLNIIPGFASNMLSRFSTSFQQLIKDLGESKTITELRDDCMHNINSFSSHFQDIIIFKQTDQIISQEIAYLKKKIIEPNLSSKQQKENLIRLMYCKMLGHNVSFAYMEVVKFTQQKSLIEKRVAYLVLGVLLEENMKEECMMSIGSIQRDLNSSNLLEVSFGLQGICELATKDMLQAVINQVVGLLKHKSEVVRKKAIMALLKFYELKPKDFDLSWFNNGLLDTDAGVMGVALNAYLTLINKDCLGYKHLVPVFISIFKQILNRKVHDGFNFNDVPSPWMQIKLLQIFSLLGKNDKNCSEKMYAILNMCLESANMQVGIGCAVAYECMKTIATIYPDSSLIKFASNKAALLLTSQNYNLKYLGLTMLSELVNIDMNYASQHQMTVIEFLSDTDETLKRKALDLLYRLTNEHNVKVVCEKFTEYLQNVVDDFMKDSLVIRISTLAERYSPDNEWYIDTMTNILEVGGDSVQKDVAFNMMKIIEEGVDDDDEYGSLSNDLRRHAVMSYINLLDRGALLSDVLVQLICWVVGKYFSLIEGYNAAELVEKFYDLLDLPFKDMVTQSWIITAIAKLVTFSDSLCIRPIEKVQFKTKDAKQRYNELWNIESSSKLSKVILFNESNIKPEHFDVNLSFLDEFVKNSLQNGAKQYSPHFISKQDTEVMSDNVELIYEHRCTVGKTDYISIPEKCKLDEVSRTESKNILITPVKELWTKEGYIGHRKGSHSSNLPDTSSVISEKLTVPAEATSGAPSQTSLDGTNTKSINVKEISPLVHISLSDRTKQDLAHQLFGAIGNSPSVGGAKSKKFQKKTKPLENLLEISHEDSITKLETEIQLESLDSVTKQLINTKTENTPVQLIEGPMNCSMINEDLSAESKEICIIKNSFSDNQPVNHNEFPKSSSDFDQKEFLPLNDAPVINQINLLDEDVSTPNMLFVLSSPLKRKVNLPERYVAYKKSVKIIELSSDTNIRVTLQYISTKNDLAIVLEIINKTCNVLTLLEMVVKMPENLISSRRPAIFNFEELQGSESHFCVLDVQFQSPSLNMVMNGCLSYRDPTFTEKKIFVNHIFQLAVLLRKVKLDSEVFKEKWNNKSLHDKHDRIVKKVKIEDFVDWMKITNIYPVQIFENEIIGATAVLGCHEILLHFKLTKTHTDLWVKSQSRLLNEMFYDAMSKKLLTDNHHDRFADYFVICGLNEEEGLEPHQCSDSEDNLLTPFQLSYKPSILWHFPENDPTNLFEPDGIKVLCMPRGVYFRKSLRRTATRFHSFLQTRENGAKIYGFVLTFFEKVKNENIIVAMDTLFKMFDTELTLVSQTDQKQTLHANKPYRENRLSSVYSFQKDNEQLFVSKSICVVMKKPFVRLARHCLENVLHVGLNEEQSSLYVESYIYNVLYEIPAPPPGRTMRYISPNGDPIIIHNPQLNELPYFDYSMKEVLLTLGLENLVDLFTCMLLEHQILLLSSDSHKLMLIAESLTTLFFPLLWQHVYVPVLPPFLLHYLDAPVPFIMGLCYETEDEKDRLDLPQEGSLCLLDIDNNSIHLPQEIPELPVRNELIAELESITNLYGIQPRKGCLLLKNSLYQTIDSDSEVFESSLNSSDILMSKSEKSYELSPLNQSSELLKNSTKLSIGRTSSLVMGKPSLHPNVKFLSGNWAGDIIPIQHEENKTSPILSKDSPESKKTINPRLAAMMAVVERAGLGTSDTLKSNNESPTSTDNMFSKEGEHVWCSRSITCTRAQQHEDEINIIVREIFVNCFTHILVDYEHFVILPQQTKEDWLVNRDQMQNFDKAAFLSDQSQAHLPFMTLFVETQGFASLIDMKIMALWEDCDPRLAFFDKRIDKLKVKLGLIRSPTYEKCTTISSAIEAYVKNCSQIDHNAIQPHALKEPVQREKCPGYFPQPDKNCILESNKRSKKVNWKKQERIQQQIEHIALNESLKNNQDGHKIKQKLAERVKKYMQESKSSNEETNETGATQRTLNVYAEKLLKECKMKTKRLVVLKLGQEAVELGHVGPNSIGIEENTLIASLCDLLERVWCHGVQLKQLEFDKKSVKSKFVQRMRQSKSALWSHLLAFYQKDCAKLAAIYGLADVESVPEELKHLVIETSRQNHHKQGFIRSKSPAIEDIGPYFDHLGKEARNEGTKEKSSPASPSIHFQSREQQDLVTRIQFLNNLKTILEMKEIKTDTGYARAWTRLALEKKTLAEELRILLDQKKILNERYKNYAFIRTEDEMEQFLFHLLSLNAVDFYCFTNGFSNTVMTYKFQLLLGKHIGSATTSSCWLNLTGSFGNTGTINIPKGESEFRFKHKNLGILTALRIGHDNMGISPGWFVEYVMVTNEITGHIYKFQCGRWLSKNEDDGSTERLLIASMLNQRNFTEKKLAQKFHHGTSGRTSPSSALTARNCSPLGNQKLTSSDIQEKMADAVNNIVKFFYKDSEENMTFLMCGEGGFCEAMKLVFLYGFKSSKLFGKNLYVWDYIKKVFDGYVYTDDSNISASALQLRSSFCTMVQTINTAQLAIGKEQKFELFLCLGLRDRYLQNWLRLLNESAATLQMYEPWSFFRDANRFSFLIGVLDSLVEFEIVLDQSVTRGV